MTTKFIKHVHIQEDFASANSRVEPLQEKYDTCLLEQTKAQQEQEDLQRSAGAELSDQSSASQAHTETIGSAAQQATEPSSRKSSRGQKRAHDGLGGAVVLQTPPPPPRKSVRLNTTSRSERPS